MSIKATWNIESDFKILKVAICNYFGVKTIRNQLVSKYIDISVLKIIILSYPDSQQ